ncbi:hypothetical protein DOM22_01910 [Bdellovibrio sp. ZAP7]|uniref:hypothetical protein n=1 Tax=Bdellovibrio sp. ZAP7 TaxID=2231053 RepID=UPI0011577DA7|nr:hypothetical protein [Bdellovibrio sp. ZAP7]QDK44003.1 hypothetical protein DOM22_01910 [Bdellovibrio sp. ZAP7]
MNKVNVKRCALAAILSIGFLAPQMPTRVFAAENAPSNFPIDLFDIAETPATGTQSNTDSPNNGNNANKQQQSSQQNNNGGNKNGNQQSGGNNNQGGNRLGPLPRPQTGGTNQSQNNNNNNNNRPNQNPNQNGSNNSSSSNNNGSRPTMKAVKVADEFACNLFENSSQAALMQAITDMNREISTKSTCAGNTSADQLQKNSQSVMQNVQVLQKIMNASPGTEVNYNELSDAMTNTMNATTTIGDILGDNSFLNSKCGSDSMKSGKALLAFNELLDGLAPMALFAVSMNAALAPALPFVLGGAVATKGITALTKVMENKTIDMSLQDQRMAVFQNTCQYIKISKKVTYLQLTAENRFNEFRNSLRAELPLYKASLNNKKLSTFTNLVSNTKFDQVKAQYIKDIKDFKDLEAAYNGEADGGDMGICFFGRSALEDLARMKSADFDFPASIFANLKDALNLDQTKKIKRVNVEGRINTIKYYESEISKANTRNPNEVRNCATNTKEWITSIKKTLTEIEQIIVDGPAGSNIANNGGKKSDAERARDEGKTFDRVKYAMEELAKDNSIVNRSNIIQGADSIKVGLFGGGSGVAPVWSWLKYTVGIYDQSMASYNKGIKDLQTIAMNITQSAADIRKHISQINDPQMLVIGQQFKEDKAQAAALSNLIPQNKYINEEKRALICKTLKQTYVQYTAAWDHLGTVQVMCDMISGVLDNSMDKKIIKYCAGDLLLSGTISTISTTQQQLQSYYKQAMLLNDRMTRLNCSTSL